jgi:Protein of unknown function (DUF3800)
LSASSKERFARELEAILDEVRVLPRAPALRLAIDFYADESCQNDHQYLVLGVLAGVRSKMPTIEEEFAALRKELKLTAEMKWTKVSKGMYHAYEAWVDLFFRQQVRYTALIVDTTKFDHKTFNEGDEEIGFNKMLYQLLLHRVGRRYGRFARIYGYLDSRTTKHTPENLRLILNAALAKHHRIDTDPFRRITFRDSHHADLIQTVDILSGAIAFQRNGHGNRQGASEAKKKLSEYILETAGKRPHCWYFHFWDFEFRKENP